MEEKNLKQHNKNADLSKALLLASDYIKNLENEIYNQNIMINTLQNFINRILAINKDIEAFVHKEEIKTKKLWSIEDEAT